MAGKNDHIGKPYETAVCTQHSFPLQKPTGEASIASFALLPYKNDNQGDRDPLPDNAFEIEKQANIKFMMTMEPTFSSCNSRNLPYRAEYNKGHTRKDTCCKSCTDPTCL